MKVCIDFQFRVLRTLIAEGNVVERQLIEVCKLPKSRSKGVSFEFTKVCRANNREQILFDITAVNLWLSYLHAKAWSRKT